MEDDIYYQYYDVLFHDKDYLHETDVVFSLAQQHISRLPRRILEIGCGTGNHTLVLAKWGIPITAIDIDPKMIKICAKKIRQLSLDHVEVKLCSIEKLGQSGFDLAISLFNVVTYLATFDQLLSFFRGIYLALAKDGVFIFDTWNGVAAFLDPPGVKKWKVQLKDQVIECQVKPTTNYFDQKTVLTYELSVFNKDSEQVAHGEHSFSQTLWTPNQLKDALRLAGFSKFSCSALFDPARLATEKDWKIMFVCQK